MNQSSLTTSICFSSYIFPALDQLIEMEPKIIPTKHGFGTLAVHAGSPHDPTTGAVIESVGDSRHSMQT